MLNTPRIICATLLLIAAWFVVPSAAPATAAPVRSDAAPFAYFPETGHNIGGEIKQFFDAYGGLAIFGLPLTEVIQDTETGLQVQYFERARVELHPELPPEHYVSLTLAGRLLTQQRTDPAFAPVAAASDPARDFFAQTGHTLGGAFRYFWQQNGGLTVFGYPISEEFYEVNPADGQEYLVQYFERARFEYHPDMAGTPYEVQLGHLGRQLLERSPTAQQATAPAQQISLLGEATTSFAASIREREHNIARATEMFNGAIVPAGSEFSFNAMGDYTEANGFVDGYAIVGGRLERVVAGGLCQVSTTLFRAVSNAGLEVTERYGHSFVVNFYENILGFDATVYDPQVDFRWRNDTAGPVFIAASSNVADATVNFQLWGYDDGRTITYDGPHTSNWTQPGPAIWEYDPTLPPGTVQQLVHGRSGVNVTYTRIITMPDGSEERTTYHTAYQPWADFYVYGPGVFTAPAVEPADNEGDVPEEDSADSADDAPDQPDADTGSAADEDGND
jgi:hypothetical protein